MGCPHWNPSLTEENKECDSFKQLPADEVAHLPRSQRTVPCGFEGLVHVERCGCEPTAVWECPDCKTLHEDLED